MSKEVYFKFKSSMAEDSIPIECSSISAYDLKLAISKRYKYQANYDLSITLKVNNQEKVCSDNDLIPAYSNVVVRRLPLFESAKTHRQNKTINPEKFNKSDPYKNMDQKGAGDVFKDMNLDTANLTEDQKLDRIVQSAAENNLKCISKKDVDGCPPPNYICNKCGVGGHWIHKCPGILDIKGKLLNSRDVKRPSGIPNTNLKEVDENTPNSYLTSEGRYVVNIKNYEAFLKGKKEKRPFSIEENPPTINGKTDEIPSHLKCNLCFNLLVKPSQTPCCKSIYCESCITERLFVPNEFGVVHTCPNCSGKVDKLDSLRDVTHLMEEITQFKEGKLKQKQVMAEAVVKVEEVEKKISEMTDDDLLNEMFAMSDKENSNPSNLVAYQNAVKNEIESIKIENDVKSSINTNEGLYATEMLKQLVSCGSQIQIQQMIQANPQVIQVIQGLVGNCKSNEITRRDDGRSRYDRQYGYNQSIQVVNSENRHRRSSRECHSRHNDKNYRGSHRDVDDNYTRREDYGYRSEHRHRRSKRSKENSREYYQSKSSYRDREMRDMDKSRRSPATSKRSREISRENNYKEEKSSNKSSEDYYSRAKRPRHDSRERYYSRNNIKDQETKSSEEKYQSKRENKNGEKRLGNSENHHNSLDCNSTKIKSTSRSRSVTKKEKMGYDESKSKHRSHKKSKKTKKSKSKHNDKKKHKKSKYSSD